MPKGFDGVRRTSAEIEQRKNSGGSSQGSLWFRLQPGQETVVRFLEQDDDIHWAHMHEVPQEGRSWGRDVPCLDQDRDGTPCPGCERDLPRKFKGYINVIWDDAPVFKRGEDGRILKDQYDKVIVVGNKPQPAIWSSGIRLFENLDEINANYRGLRSRRFKVKRKGEKLNTTYVVTPENVDEGAQDFSAEELEMQENKYDLSVYVKPPTYEEFMAELGQGGHQQNYNGGEQRQVNPFLRS